MNELFDDLPLVVPIELQLVELRRERELRDTIYPRWISTGQLKAGVALKRNLRLDAAIATLTHLSERLDAGGQLDDFELLRVGRFAVLDRAIGRGLKPKSPRFAVIGYDDAGPKLHAGPFDDLGHALDECKRLQAEDPTSLAIA